MVSCRVRSLSQFLNGGVFSRFFFRFFHVLLVSIGFLVSEGFSVGFLVCWLLVSLGFWLLLAFGFWVCWLLVSVGFWLLLALGFCLFVVSVGFWLLLVFWFLLAFGFCWFFGLCWLLVSVGFWFLWVFWFLLVFGFIDSVGFVVSIGFWFLLASWFPLTFWFPVAFGLCCFSWLVFSMCWLLLDFWILLVLAFIGFLILMAIQHIDQ